MRIDILTLFPDMVRQALGESIIGRGQEFGLLQIEAHNIRDYTLDKHHHTDDYPYGGGMGMVMQCNPSTMLGRRCAAAKSAHHPDVPPRGPLLPSKSPGIAWAAAASSWCAATTKGWISALSTNVWMKRSAWVIKTLGGEIAAMAITDAVCRMVPGVLADETSFTEESHFSGVLEYPQYTRPEVWHGRPVPPVLLSGHHKNIQAWRRLQSLLRTRERRPDLFSQLTLSPEDEKLLAQFYGAQ